MDQRHPNHPSDHHVPSESTSRRRARSYSQPVSSPVPGPSHRPQDPFDFLSNPAYAGQPSNLAPFPHPSQSFDDEELLRSFLSMSDESHGPQTHPHPFTQPSLLAPQPAGFPMAPPASSSMHHLPSQQLSNPLVQQAFVAWLQYMQLQTQLQHQQQAQPPQPQRQAHPGFQHQSTHPSYQQAQSVNAPYQQNVFAASPTETVSPLQRDSRSPEANEPSNAPSPDVGDQGDPDASGGNITEEKRRRNTAASARFRVKKKQWTMNLERSITELSTRVEELEREASELRRENGWLKEIVMLKSKRFGGQAPNPEADSPSQPVPTEPLDSDLSGDDGGDDAEARPGDKGKGVQR